MRTAFSRLRDERGSALVAAGIMAASFVLLGAVVVEVGQWLAHRRHLQVRVDAAAFSGGQAMAECFNVGFNNFTENMADADIENAAKDYGGITSNKNLQNLDTGTGEQSLMSFQSDTYPSVATPNPTRNLHNECFNGATPNLMLDVKMAETGIPKFFGFSPLETVHAWARVQLQEILSLIPTLPLAIPDVRPKQVAVTFVNNSTGNALANCPNGCVFQLTGPTQSGQLNDWGANVTIPAAAWPAANANVGMRVGVGSQVSTCAHVNATATYTCYDYSGTGGIIALRSYSTTAVGTPVLPVLRAVTPNTCSSTPYFSTYQATAGTCSSGVTATVDFGLSGPVVNTQVRATINGQNLTMTRNAGTNTWVSAATPLVINGGPYPVTMEYCIPPTNCNNRNNFTNFNGGNPVQQIFGGSDNSSPTLPGGPIFAASVLDTSPSNPNPAAYSFPANPNQALTLAVTLGLAGGVHLPVRCANGTSGKTYSCATDPPVLLRFTKTAGNDSHSYSIDCGGGPNIRDQIVNGCTDPYSLNSADVCPDPANPTPTDCADIQTGGAVGQIRSGMNTRFAPGNVCTTNHYPDLSFLPNDPRAVTLVITDFSAFTGAGNGQVPVVTFATFYVTGWDGAVSSCATQNETAPSGVGNGDLWGHFVADVNLGGIPSGRVCLPGVTPCAIALVR